ncbi:MAG: tyrosine-type recombinase/integrase [Negativicutes bacterium]
MEPDGCIDERGTVTVLRELVKAEGGTIFQSPKTKRSSRLVPFGGALKSLMIAHQLRQEEFIKKTKEYKNQNLLFARETGNPYYPDSLRKILHRILKKAGIANVRVHDLRHTCATLLMLSGVHSKVVQEILGHSNIGITLDIYSHTLPSMRSEAADSINNFVAASKHEETNSKSTESNLSEPIISPEMISPAEIETLPHPSKMN